MYTSMTNYKWATRKGVHIYKLKKWTLNCISLTTRNLLKICYVLSVHQKIFMMVGSNPPPPPNCSTHLYWWATHIPRIGSAKYVDLKSVVTTYLKYRKHILYRSISMLNFCPKIPFTAHGCHPYTRTCDLAEGFMICVGLKLTQPDLSSHLAHNELQTHSSKRLCGHGILSFGKGVFILLFNCYWV